jgi:ubiquinone/menaquinone biosynthesis C-methylase UbiE
MQQATSSTDRPVVFDRAADFYDATRGFPPGVEERVAELVARAGGLGPASRVLEIGIGTGRIALPLVPRVERVAGVDLSAPMLAQLAAKRGERRAFPARADAAALPFADARFDAVVAVHVFHLIPRWRDVLGEVARVLRPDGLLLHAADDGAGAGLGISPNLLAAQIGHRNAGVARDRIESFPEDAGWTLVPPVHRIAFARRLRPQQLLDRLTERSWSSTWELTDAQLASAIETARAALLARFGALDREVEIETGFWVRAYRPPR